MNGLTITAIAVIIALAVTTIYLVNGAEAQIYEDEFSELMSARG